MADLIFEVQIHTHESWEAKQKTHNAYEKNQRRENPVRGESKYLRCLSEHMSVLRFHNHMVAQEIPDYRKEDNDG